MAAPLAGAALWGTFNVLDDPKCSREAPVEVPGRVRLAVELSLLSSGWLAYGIAGRPAIGAVLAALTGLHHAVGRTRVQWLLGRWS